MSTTRKRREKGLLRALKAAGGYNALARICGIDPAAVFHWKRVPADRIVQIEAATKVPREELRPDLYRAA